MIYNAAVLASLLEDPTGHALYLFPLKALEQDQLDEALTLIDKLGGQLRAAVYDGDTPDYQRKKIKAAPPQLLISTPDMLHAGILAFHEQWAAFFAKLRYVIIDELHTYSGIFGTHVLHLFRRLNRLCAFYGSSPVYITCSATIGNPRLARNLVNRPFRSSPKAGPYRARHFLLLSPVSPNTLAARLLQLSVGREFAPSSSPAPG